MASLIGDLIVAIFELAFWVVFEVLPTVFYFTGLVMVFAATRGRVAVEFSKKLKKVGWTGDLRVLRSPEGPTTLSPALGVIVGFIVWAIIVSASIIFYTRT